MEDKGQSMLSNSYGMKGGDGPNSYAQKSVYHVYMYTSNVFHTTKSIEAIECKFTTHGLISPEFHVFFNDQVGNDFNSLFATLPVGKKYYAAGVPGSFHDRLFPTASLHFVFSSCALHWLSKVPKGVVDKTGPPWNKGRIHYGGAPKEVFEAYSDQFATDMNSFLQARVKELAPGALMALVTLAVPDVAPGLQFTLGLEIELLGFILMDMEKMELRKVIEGNERFRIERMEILSNPKQHIATPDLRQRMRFMRAASEILIEKHFGTEIIDQLFEIYTRKLSESSLLLNPDNYQQMIASELINVSDNFLHVVNNDPNSVNAAVQKRLASEDPDLTKEERMKRRQFLESYSDEE
ncbi:hypothetical protein PTKIN_Ptkin16aG0012000 [Pterospermum kingtungense]